MSIHGLSSEHLGRIHRLSREHSVSIRIASREYPESIQGVSREYPGSIQGVSREYPGSLPGAQTQVPLPSPWAGGGCSLPSLAQTLAPARLLEEPQTTRGLETNGGFKKKVFKFLNLQKIFKIKEFCIKRERKTTF